MKSVSGVEKESRQLSHDDPNGPLATGQLPTLFAAFGDKTIEETAGMKRNVEPANQKNSEAVVEMGAAEETDESTEEAE